MDAHKRSKVETMDEELSGESLDRSRISSARRSISPPSRKRHRSSQMVAASRICGIPGPSIHHDNLEPPQKDQNASLSISVEKASSASVDNRPSPLQLISVADIPSSYNIDTISLRDILGEPLIQECWIFNYLFDIDFVMEQFDEDTRDLVRIKIVHGSWKKEDSNRMRIEEAAKRYANVQPITAYMPEAYGTHHSKMIILFRHDGLAQVVIVTANMVAGDWRMCQAVWRSPLLQKRVPSMTQVPSASDTPRLGSGARFKRDLLAYLEKYQKRTTNLVAQLDEYDFGSVRAALIGSTPSKLDVRNRDLGNDILWGWPALKRILNNIPTMSNEPQIVIQVSSIASVGEKWVSSTFFEALSATATPKGSPTAKPKFSIVFPTADEIRRSIDGYSAGSSVHMKLQSAAQLKQLDFLKPMLCHWAGDHEIQPQSHASLAPPPAIRKAGRRRTVPHIKTYVRFSDASMTKIDWAMMTSANLSTQAWGAACSVAGEVRVCSYEIGIVVWPQLWDEDDKPGSAEMIPVFQRDVPSPATANCNAVNGNITSDDDNHENGKIKTRIGWRMPYDLPLVPYQKEEMPWCASAPCLEPDWMGRIWPGFSPG